MKYLALVLLISLVSCRISGISTTRGKLRVYIAPIPVVTVQPHVVPPLPTATPLPDWYYTVTPEPTP